MWVCAVVFVAFQAVAELCHHGTPFNTQHATLAARSRAPAVPCPWQMDTVLLVLEGVKHVLLFPPAEAARLGVGASVIEVKSALEWPPSLVPRAASAAANAAAASAGDGGKGDASAAAATEATTKATTEATTAGGVAWGLTWEPEPDPPPSPPFNAPPPPPAAAGAGAPATEASPPSPPLSVTALRVRHFATAESEAPAAGTEEARGDGGGGDDGGADREGDASGGHAHAASNATVVHATIHAGEALFIPRGWLHNVRSSSSESSSTAPSSCRSVALNFWFDVTTDDGGDDSASSGGSAGDGPRIEAVGSSAIGNPAATVGRAPEPRKRYDDGELLVAH